jgi:hypothetical protein
VDLNFYIGWFGSGDADSVVPLTATRYSIDALHLPTLTNWYPWYDNEEVSQSNYYGNTSSFVTSIVFHNYNYHVLMVQILFRSLDGVKSIRVWHWWQSEGQAMRSPSIVHDKAWSSSSISYKISPCLGLRIAFNLFRILSLYKEKPETMQVKLLYNFVLLSQFPLTVITCAISVCHSSLFQSTMAIFGTKNLFK